jgi:hypothetical protein
VFFVYEAKDKGNGNGRSKVDDEVSYPMSQKRDMGHPVFLFTRERTQATATEEADPFASLRDDNQKKESASQCEAMQTGGNASRCEWVRWARLRADDWLQEPIYRGQVMAL